MLVRAYGLGGDRPKNPVGEFDRWLLETRNCGVAALETFATGLAQDGTTVRAALTTSWSNAQAERKMISVRTKAALAAAKERGVKLSGPTHHLPAQASRAAAASASVQSAGASRRAEELARDIAELRAEGATALRELAASLDRRGLTTSRGATWADTPSNRHACSSGARM